MFFTGPLASDLILNTFIFRSKVWTLAFTGLFILSAAKVSAQNSGTLGLQRDQQGAFGVVSPGALGAAGQPDVGRGFSGPGGQVGGLGQVGPRDGLTGQQGPRQDSFVGSDAQQVRNQRNNRNRQRRATPFDFDIESFNEMRESRRNRRGNRNQRPQVRVRIKPLFTVAQPSQTQLMTRSRTQLKLNKVLPVNSRAVVSMSGSIATLEGVVPSDYDKLLAEKMLSLQPGISQVENRLSVEQAQVELLLAPPVE